MSPKFRVALGAVFLLVAGGVVGAVIAHKLGRGTTVVYLVRHAEKAPDGGRDPGLSEIGEARARALARTLADAGITQIFTTSLRRARDTAAPLVERISVKPTRVTAEGDVRAQAEALARQIREDHAGRSVLVVGHSNTVPAIMAALGAPDIGTLSDDAYDDLFILTLRPDGSVAFTRAHQGFTGAR